MTWADGAAFLIVAVSGLLALARGFVREILGLAAWVGAGITAVALYPFVEPMILGLVHEQKLALPVAIGVVFIVVLVVLSIIAAWIASLVHGSMLAGLDRTLGLAFGLARGGVIVCLVFIFLSMFLQPPEWPTAVTHAKFLPYPKSSSAWLIDLLPKPYRPTLAPPGSAKENTSGANEAGVNKPGESPSTTGSLPRAAPPAPASLAPSSPTSPGDPAIAPN